MNKNYSKSITTRGDEIYKILSSFGEMAWGKSSPGIRKNDRYNTYEEIIKKPHFTAWRWKNPDPEIDRLIVEAVESFEGQIEWEIRSRNRIPKLGGTNWVIEPPRKREFWNEHKDLPASEVARLIKEKEPEIGILSNQDVPQLAEHIKRYVEENRQSGNSEQPEKKPDTSQPFQPQTAEELLSFKPVFPPRPDHIIAPGIEGLFSEYFGQSYDELYQKYNSYRIIPLAVASYKERVDPVVVKLSIKEIKSLIGKEYDEKYLRDKVFPKYGIKVEMSRLGVTYIGFLERVHEELVGKKLYY